MARTAEVQRPVVCMFVRNQFRHDARVTREATTLIEEGFDVVVFAVATKPAEAGEERQGPIRVIRVTLPTSVWSFLMFIGSMIGAYSRALKLASRVTRRIKVRVGVAVAPRPPASPRTVAAALAGRARLREFLMPMHRFLQGRRFGRVAGEQAAGLRPVAYHCHDLNAIVAGYHARRRHRAPLIYDAHELWPHRNRPDMRRRKTRVLERADRFFSRRADAVVTVDESIAEHLKSRYGLRRVVVVRNVPSLTARAGLPEHGVLDDLPRPRLLYVGGVQTYRGIEQVIAALPMIRDAVFVVVGPGDPSYRAGLERLALENGVADRVRFIEWVPTEAVIPTVAQGDLGLCLIQNACLSYYYSLPNKMFEYVHAGLPVLASDFPEARRLVRAYEFGALVDPGDPAAIARSVNDLLGRPDDLARMRDHALKAAQELNWERERERLVGLYAELVPARAE